MKRSRSSFFNRMSLAWQIVVLLSIALLPIGGLAVFEAMRANDRAKSLAASDLLADARQAAETERLEIAEGFGAARTLGRNSRVYDGTSAECSAELARFIGESERNIFAAFIGANGLMKCSSLSSIQRDLSESESYLLQREEPRRTVSVVESGNVTSRAVLIISHPVIVDGTWRGTISLSVPREVMSVFSEDDAEGALNVALIDNEGKVLSRNVTDSEQAWWLPVGLSNNYVNSNEAIVFEGVDAFGGVRTYARVPIVEDEIAGLFSKPDGDLGAAALMSVLRAILLPSLVWVLCIALAYFAMRRLVVSGIQRIQRSVVAFKRGDRERAMRPIAGASGELEELSSSFVEMARAVDAGEQELSDLVEEKTVLLLEVYHRVKNNLQLIISIMNIQVRGAQDERERMAIRTLRERVMGLALVHQRLYETPNLTSVPADKLVREIVSNLSDAKAGESGATILSDLATFNLHPDQAVPFSLLVTEAMMNALNYSGRGTDDWRIEISLRLTPEDVVELNVTNTVPEDETIEPPEPRSGMGKPLMRAFVMQLAGTMEISHPEGKYALDVAFKRASLDEQGGQRIGMPGQSKAEYRANERAAREPAA